MSNNNADGSRFLRGVLFAVLIAVSGLASCGHHAGDASLTTESPTVILTASPSSIANGATSNLSWTSTKTSSCVLSGGQFSPGILVNTNDGRPATPVSDTAYTVTCNVSGGTISQSTTVLVGAPPVVSTFYASSTFIGDNTATTLNWSSTGSTSCTLSATGGVTLAPTPVSTAGSQSTGLLPATTTTTYALFCSNAVPVDSPASTTTITTGCVPTTVSGVSGAITLPNSNIASRLSGVAPLAVFFDASATTNTPPTRPFHDLEYVWSFGDGANLSPPLTGVSTWNTGSRAGVSSRNAATGPVAAHVYETPGNYTVTLTATDGTNTESNACIGITVENPDTKFAGANTTCIGATSNPAQGAGGCPAGANTAQQSNFATAISSYARTGKRVLFKRGDTFTTSTSSSVPAGSGGLIGAYGTGALPLITSSTSDVGMLKFATTAYDWRVMDLNFAETTAANTAQAILQGSTDTSQITVLRVTTTGFSKGASFSKLSISPDQIAIVDSNFSVGSTSAASYGLYCAVCTRVVVLGSYMNIGNATTNHNARLQGVTGFVYSNNTIVGGSSSDGFTIRGDSQYGIVSDNNFPSGGGGINPENNSSNQSQRDVIFERNWFAIPSASTTMMGVSAVNVTIRNNIFNLTNSPNWKAIDVNYTNTAGSPMPTGINIYNNTVYNSGSESGNFSLVSFGAGLTAACAATVNNNLGYSPNSTSISWIKNTGSCVVTGAAGTMGNSSNAQILTDPLFAFATPVNPVDFKIGTGSYAANNTGDGAVSLYPSIYDDFFHCHDVTATNYRSGAAVPAASASCN